MRSPCLTCLRVGEPKIPCFARCARLEEWRAWELEDRLAPRVYAPIEKVRLSEVRQGPSTLRFFDVPLPPLAKPRKKPRLVIVPPTKEKKCTTQKNWKSAPDVAKKEICGATISRDVLSVATPTPTKEKKVEKKRKLKPLPLKPRVKVPKARTKLYLPMWKIPGLLDTIREMAEEEVRSVNNMCLVLLKEAVERRRGDGGC